MSHAFISMAVTKMSSRYRDGKNGEITEINVENKNINGLETNLECVILTFNHKWSVLNVCCGPQSGKRRALISTSGRNKHCVGH